MRKSDFYGVDVPELGDRADITVVSQAIIDGENNQSGRVEHLKAANSGTTLILSSETRSDKLIKYYNGLSIQFVSPVNITAGNSYKIKIDNLAEQPYNNKTDIKAGDIVQAYYGASGFVSSNTPIPRSSSTSSSSEITVATSLAVKNANDNANTRALKTTQIIAGNGLIGGGALDTNRTINVASADDSITVGADNIKVNTYNGVDGTSTTRPASANAVKQANDNANTRFPKCVYYTADLSTEEALYNLPAGIFHRGISAVYELPTRYYTLFKPVSKSDTSDSFILAFQLGGSGVFYIGSFNSGRWTGWVKHEPSSSCPYNIGDIYITTKSENPSTIWLGTTWEKIENRFLLGTSSSGSAGQTGGSMSKTIARANLPNEKLQVNSFSLSRGTMDITGKLGDATAEGGYTAEGAFGLDERTTIGRAAGAGTGHIRWNFKASRAWTGTTSSASPQTSALGSGQALDITPSYYTVNIWKRLS